MHRQPMQLLFSDIVKVHEHKNIFEWDPHDLLCTEYNCTYDILENVNYFDSGHLTNNGSLFLKPYFADFLKKNYIF